MATNYIRIEDAVRAVEFGITHASAINIETGEWTELFQRENDELREAVERIKDIKPADVVPVVTCRDCKNWQGGMPGMGCYWDADYPQQENDFCSHGVRR